MKQASPASPGRREPGLAASSKTNAGGAGRSPVSWCCAVTCSCILSGFYRVAPPCPPLTVPASSEAESMSRVLVGKTVPVRPPQRSARSEDDLLQPGPPIPASRLGHGLLARPTADRSVHALDRRRRGGRAAICRRPPSSVFALRKTAPRTAAAGLAASGLPAEREKWTFSRTRNVSFRRNVAFDAARLPPPARLGTISHRKIVPNRKRTRFLLRKSSPTGVRHRIRSRKSFPTGKGRDFVSENRPQLKRGGGAAGEKSVAADELRGCREV